MRYIMGLLMLISVAYLGALSYERYTHHWHDLFLMNHWKGHYQIKQMSHGDLLCRDSRARLCICGTCR